MTRRILPLDDALYDYVLGHSLREHPELQALREATQQHPHAAMQIPPEQGQLLALLARLVDARQAIEVGVFTGYSALAVALALPADGRLLACDISDADARIGRPFWERAGVAARIDLRIAPAAQTLQGCLDQGEAGRYDFAFIDADKAGYDRYYELALQLLRPGGLVVFDNMLRGGAVARPAQSPELRVLQLLNDKLHADGRVDLALLPIADGVTLARKR